MFRAGFSAAARFTDDREFMLRNGGWRLGISQSNFGVARVFFVKAFPLKRAAPSKAC
jgi:hypothetical protein